MEIIRENQSLIKSSLYYHIRLENIKKLYKSASKFDYKQNYKAIIETAMVSTSEGIIYNIPLAVGTLVITKKPTARKLLSKFSTLLYVTQNTDGRRLGDSKTFQVHPSRL